MKIILCLFAFICSTVYGKSLSITLRVAYDRPAQVFEFIDNLSSVRENRLVEYEDAFKKVATLSDLDQKYLYDYKVIRKKYLLKKQEVAYKGFSPNMLEMDPISDSFYHSKDIKEAYSRLTKILKGADFAIIKESIDYFIPKLDIFSNESEMFKQIVSGIEKDLGKARIKQIAEKASSFFNVKGKKLTVNYKLVWWPQNVDGRVDLYGDTIIYRLNPLTFSKANLKDLASKTILLISSMQSELQKENLEKVFYSACPIQNTFRSIDMIESPIIVVFGKMFVDEYLDKNNFSLIHEWSIHPWINHASKFSFTLIHDDLKKHKTISDGIMQSLGKSCQEVFLIHQFLLGAK